MISKDKFKKCIKYLERSWEFGRKINGLIREYDDVSDWTFGAPGADELLVDVLEEAFGLHIDGAGYSTLTWWIYETDFGKEKKILYSFEQPRLPEDHPYRFPKLDTADDLYDFLLWEIECDRGG